MNVSNGHVFVKEKWLVKIKPSSRALDISPVLSDKNEKEMVKE
jgi:hypothetical protein